MLAKLWYILLSSTLEPSAEYSKVEWTTTQLLSYLDSIYTHFKQRIITRYKKYFLNIIKFILQKITQVWQHAYVVFFRHNTRH